LFKKKIDRMITRQTQMSASADRGGLLRDLKEKF